MRCLVTGAAGFIGSHLVERLVRDGHDVVALDDLSTGHRSNLAAVPSVQMVVGDVRDVPLVRDLANGCSTIFHLAAIRSVMRSVDEPLLSTSVNVDGTVSVLEAARAAGAGVVLASSSSVYGDQGGVALGEDLAARPGSPYAATKLAAETMAATWWRAFRTPSVSLRYFNVYGPRMDPAGPYALVVPIFVRALLDERRPVVHGDGLQARDFTYIDDAIQATVSAAAMPPELRGRPVNVGGGAKPTTINELLNLTAAAVGVTANPEFAAARPVDMRYTEADIGLARRTLAYAPTVAIGEGIRRTVAWQRSVDAATKPG